LYINCPSVIFLLHILIDKTSWFILVF
jgi:hypothetical protein